MRNNLRLKMLILERFRYQADFAEAAGFREERISRIINGRAEPTDDEKARIVEKLGVSLSEVFPV